MYSIEKNIPLAESCLWQAQRQFFNEEGINAWQGKVPFFVTSNPFIANSYAKLILAHLQDLLAEKQLKTKEPFYIFELGTGSGQFSFYCMQALQELLDATKLDLPPICYVLTDFTDRNLAFWREQTAFQTITAIDYDFALFDLEQPKAIHLERQNRKLTKLANPAVLIGNYIFDSVRQNYYAMEHGTLMEKRIETLAPFKDYDRKQKKLLSLKEAKIEAYATPYVWQEPATPDELYLRFYDTHLDKGLFSLPIGGFSALDFFQKLAPQGFMLISSDKGSNSLTELASHKNLELVPHGSFSLDVNFHALGLYFEFCGGRAFLQSYRDGIKTNVFLSKATDMPTLEAMVTEVCERLSPADYFQYHRCFRDSTFKAKAALTQFNLGHHDPYVLSLFIDKLCAELKNSKNKALVETYCELIPKFYAHIYPLPKGTDYYFDLGLLLHTLERYADAIPYFETSMAQYGEKFATAYNLGICLYMTGQVEKSIPLFKVAEQLETKGETKGETKAKTWLEKAQQN